MINSLIIIITIDKFDIFFGGIFSIYSIVSLCDSKKIFDDKYKD